VSRKAEKTKRAIRSFRYKHLDGFIFIHINKTGGSSIEKALKIPLEHQTAREKIEEIGLKKWNRKLTFAVVRNPWDKVVSHYYYRVKTNQTGLRDNPIDFKDWVKRTYGKKDAVYYDKPKMFMPQTDWITDNKNNIVVDEVIRFENIEDEFSRVLDKINKKVRLPHMKKSGRDDYWLYYDDDTAEIVRKWFYSDIETFGYNF